MRNPFGEVHKAEYDDNGFFCVRDIDNHLCCKIYSKSQAKFLVAAINGYEATETKLKGYATLLGSANNDVKQLSKYADELEAKIADQQTEIKKLKKMLADNPTQSDMDAAQFALNLQQKQIADQQAEIERQKQQIEYWQQICREKGVEIIDKSPIILAAAKEIKCPEPELAKLADSCDCAFSDKHRAIDWASMDKLEKQIADQRAEIERLKKELCNGCVYLEADKKIINEHIDKEIAMDKQIANQQVEIEQLKKREQKLNALEAAGVDNWEWYGDAMGTLDELD